MSLQPRYKIFSVVYVTLKNQTFFYIFTAGTKEQRPTCKKSRKLELVGAQSKRSYLLGEAPDSVTPRSGTHVYAGRRWASAYLAGEHLLSSRSETAFFFDYRFLPRSFEWSVKLRVVWWAPRLAHIWTVCVVSLALSPSGILCGTTTLRWIFRTCNNPTVEFELGMYLTTSYS